MAIPGKLTVDKTTGKLTGPADLHYNTPFPCVNGTPHITGKMRGTLMHTMVGTLEGTIAVFNKPGFGASAHFGISQAGRIHCFGPIGKGWEAWHAFAANREYYGIEFEDNGDPNNPISGKAITAAAQVLECLSSFAGFPLQLQDNCASSGFAYHSLCESWNLNHHTCPDMPPRHVRSSQRAAIIDLAKKIRAAATVPPPFPSGRHVVDGTGTLAGLAKRQGCQVADIWWQTILSEDTPAATGKLGPLQRAYLNAGKWDETMPAGMIVWLP